VINFNLVKLKKILKESKIESTQPDVTKRLRVRLNCMGVEKRPDTNEKEGATKYYKRKSGQFIYGRQNLHKGAFGVIPKELDGYESSADIPAFDVHPSCKPEWIELFFKQDSYYLQLSKLVTGVGSRRISPAKFLNLEMPLPSIDTQIQILEKVVKEQKIHALLNAELTHQKTLLKKLRQQILQEAIEGKLTADWRAANPDVAPASELLKRIAAEKAELVKAGKIKQQKPLPPIRDEEKPFGLPEGWVWCRLGELIYTLQYGTSKKCSYDISRNTPILRIPNISSGTIDSRDLKYTDLTEKEKKMYLLQNRDLLLIRSNGSKDLVGKSVLVSEKFKHFGYAGYLIRLRFGLDKLNISYLQKYLGSWILREQIETPLRTTVGIKNINSTELSKLLIPLPSLPEQQAIVTKIEKLLTLCDQLETQITQNQNHAEALMQAVLREAFAHSPVEAAHELNSSAT